MGEVIGVIIVIMILIVLGKTIIGIICFIVDLFTGNSASSESRDTYTRRLFDAIWEEDVERVQTLIKLGADVNAKNNDGKRPLEVAKARGNETIISLLTQNGAY